MAFKLSLVIPTYNEAANLENLCRKLVNLLAQADFEFEIIIVDDNSPDQTWKIAEELAKQDPRIRLIRRMAARGLASAVVSGWEAARGEILGVMDADLQHPVELLKEMLGRIFTDQQTDIVIASRYVAGGRISQCGFWGIFRSRMAIWAGRLILPKIFKSIKDPLSGYFILRKDVVAGKKIKVEGYKILLEILARGNWRTTYELPYSFILRKAGKSKAGWKEYFAYLFQLAQLRKLQGGYV